jgi:hypothetical protein
MDIYGVYKLKKSTAHVHTKNNKISSYIRCPAPSNIVGKCDVHQAKSVCDHRKRSIKGQGQNFKSTTLFQLTATVVPVTTVVQLPLGG